MGIDRYFAEFLGCAHKAGVDFSRTATVGRLNLFIDRRSLSGRIHRWAKAHNDFFLRYSPGPLYDLALSTLVRGLPRRGFRRRQFTPLRSLRR